MKELGCCSRGDGSGCVFIALRALVLTLKRAGRPRVASAACRRYLQAG